MQPHIQPQEQFYQDAPQAVSSLEDLEAWCLSAEEGDEADFSVGGEVSQREASRFAYWVNQQRQGHVWVEVKVGSMGLSPEPTTPIHVRCTN